MRSASRTLGLCSSWSLICLDMLRHRPVFGRVRYRRGEDLRDEIRKAMATVVPSEWYENNPLSVIESFALGKPVVGARIGGIPELVTDGKTGYTFEAGNVIDLREKLTAMTDDPARAVEMGQGARRLVEQHNSPDGHYDRLLEIYERACDSTRHRVDRGIQAQ